MASGPFFHGGFPGLQPGDHLLTYNQQRRTGTATLHHLQAGYADGTTDPDMVYLSTDPEVARAFAALIRQSDEQTGVIFSRGALYEIEPIGRVFPDSDFRPDVADAAGRTAGSWSARGARIVRVLEDQVHLDSYSAAARTGPFRAWADGSPIYDAHGFFLATPVLRERGYDDARLRREIPRWAPIELVDAMLNRTRSGQRPRSSVCPSILREAADCWQVWERRRRPLAAGVTVREVPGAESAADDLVVLRAAIGEQVVGEVRFRPRPIVCGVAWEVAALEVEQAWRGRGVSTLLLTSTDARGFDCVPAFVFGECAPDDAAVFAAAGCVVLRPDADAPFPLENSVPFPVPAPGRCWFFRHDRY
ncbi:hypothetical protein [Curtobacterium sp. 20TX0008]|uniref:hypothetical protein n=1 Tax=Curtobacterium sp. 20TX0008 TaxID=3022018 RepID=UPI00232FA59F|nr:hypothetical protein [Curtobacterium sp. 20TX0008]MDB6425937.1 hypothetical protein [Curtobacterium sp. 20TX0008]